MLKQYNTFEVASDLGTRDMEDKEIKLQKKFLKKNKNKIVRYECGESKKVKVEL